MFVKLFHTILKSSVWLESPTTRIVWITFLLEADEEGVVRGVDELLASAARVTMPEFTAALEVLMAPDLKSQTQDFGGRRIERTEGGFLVLNYRKYREYRTRAQVKEAEKKRRQRAKSNGDNGLPPVDGGGAGAVPGHVPDVPTIASVSSSVLQLPNAVDTRARGEWTHWCIECGGRKDARGGSYRLLHLDWCPRRNG